MKSLIGLAILLLTGIEFVVLALHRPALLPLAAGAALSLLFFGVHRLLGESGPGQAPETSAAGEDGPLRRWLGQAEAMIRWSESSRTDWDRRWRPALAQRFELMTGQRRTEDPVAFQDAGNILLGESLWPWVDPGNVASDGDDRSGPGRAVLEEILLRLEHR